MLLSATVVLCTQCAKNPVTGKKQLVTMSTEQELAMGKEGDAQIIAQFGLYEDSAQPDSVVSDFKRTHDSLELTNTIARTPGRNIWRIDTLKFTDLKKSAVAADSLEKAGFQLMGWDLEWHFDHKTMCVATTADKMVAQIDSVFKHNRTKNKDHLVLLAHDQAYAKSEDSFQLRQFFQLLKQKDYELSLVTDYPGMKTADSMVIR